MIMGTSTCHVMNASHLAEVPGMCGVVRDGIVPGLYGYEAGQTGVGDCFGWVADLVGGEHERLSELAGAQEVGAHGLLALDWLNGNRSVLVDHELSGVVVGLTLATRAEDLYRALVEATAFGTRVILDAFADAGLPVRELMVAGGLLQNPFVMQVYADVTRMPLHAIGSAQGPALGAAMHAAVAAGVHPDIRAAAAAMGTLSRDAFVPDERRADAYDVLHARYVRLHDHFGRGGDDVLHRLREVRPRELAHG
jgi:L-ribulokinase